MSEFKMPTEVVELPSKGLLYPKSSPLSSGTIEMKYMTAKEEDILTNQSYIQKGTVLDKLLQSLIVSNIDYNELMLKFLLIWAKYNTNKCIEGGIQHKSLEYAFNISLMFNKLRCLWIKEPISSKNLDTYGSMKKYKELEQKMVQCGVKPALLDDSPEEDVYSSGTSGKNMHRIYNKLF